MAKYEDYAKKDGDLETEIDDAANQSQTREGESGFTMPERFTGKSAEDIARSYTELEALNSRQAQDLGTMRRTVDEFVTLQSKQPDVVPEPVEPVTMDDLYDDPEAAMRKGVENVVGDRISQLEQELAEAKVQTKLDGLNVRFQGWQQTVESPEFANWVQQSPYRTKMAQRADQWDLDAADEILGLYAEATDSQSQASQARRDANLQNATLESGAAAVELAEPSFSRAALMNMRISAKQGDRDAVAYMEANAEAIAIAYEEGTITD
jgi:hypothetical protein